MSYVIQRGLGAVRAPVISEDPITPGGPTPTPTPAPAPTPTPAPSTQTQTQTTPTAPQPAPPHPGYVWCPNVGSAGAWMGVRADGKDPCTAERGGTITASPQKQLQDRCRAKGYPETICNRAGQRPYETWTKIEAAAKSYGKNVHEHRPEACASLPSNYVAPCQSILTNNKGAYFELVKTCADTGMPPDYVGPCVEALQQGATIDDVVKALQEATPAGAPAPAPTGGGPGLLIYAGVAAGLLGLYLWRRKK